MQKNPSHLTHREAPLISDSEALRQAPVEAARLWTRGVGGSSVTYGVPVYSPAYSATKLYCLVTEARM